MKTNDVIHKPKEELANEVISLQEELKSQENFRNIFTQYYDNIPAYVYIKDTESNYLFINTKCEELFGVNRGELDEKNYTDFDFFDAEMAEQLRENDKYVMQTGKSIETDEIGKPEGDKNFDRKAGFRYYLALKFPLRDPDGSIIGVCGFSYDITKQRELEKELQSTNEKLQQALSELKILQGIIPICAYCHQIRNDKGAWEQMESYIVKHSEATFSHGVCPTCYEREIEKMKEESD